MNPLTKILSWLSPSPKPVTVPHIRHQVTYLQLPSGGVAMIARFSGVCGYGCGSANSVGQMEHAIYPAYQKRRPDALILDLCEFAYEWGDNLTEPFGFHSDDDKRDGAVGCPVEDLQHLCVFPVVYVISDINRAGLTSLITAELDAEPADLLFETLETAAEAVSRQLASTRP